MNEENGRVAPKEGKTIKENYRRWGELEIAQAVNCETNQPSAFKPVTDLLCACHVHMAFLRYDGDS